MIAERRFPPPPAVEVEAANDAPSDVVAVVTRPDFPEPPGDQLIEAFRRHLAETASPETFPAISTDTPPAEGTVVVLLHPVDLNRKRRPDRDEAPCPICSPSHPKWLHKGSLIWCEASKAIYAVGPACSNGLWADGRMDRAINRFKESQKAKEDGKALYHLVRRAPRILEWIADHAVLAAQVDAAHASCRRDAPRLRRILHQNLKPSGYAVDRRFLGDRAVGRIDGFQFLTGGWTLAKDLVAAKTVWAALPQGEQETLLDWIEALAPSVRAARLAEVRAAHEGLKKAAERMRQATSFLHERTVATMIEWSRCEAPPVAFSVSHSATKATYRSGAEAWAAPKGLYGVEDVP